MKIRPTPPVSLPTPGRRALPLVGLVALLTFGVGAGLAPTSPDPPARHGSSPARTTSLFLNQHSAAVIREPDYRLLIAQGSGEATLETRRGRLIASFPLVALAGESSVPGGVHASVSATPAGIEVTAVTAGHVLLDQATVIAHRSFFTVDFQVRLGAEPSLTPDFFFNGVRGFQVEGVSQGFTPDPRGALVSGTPSTKVARHGPFSPPPFDLEFDSTAGWVGVGLVQVPNATDLSLAGDRAVQVNYPLSTLATFRDRGAGGLVGHSDRAPVLGFPEFVFTLGSGPWSGLSSYHDALKSLGFAPQAAPPGRRQGWWSRPLVDTWGQQVVDGADRTSPLYTASWARTYVESWISRYRLKKVTVVLDSQWQKLLGEATPSSRFGGVAGMRRLISAFHRQGIHVLLWWPLWVRGFSYSQRRPAHRHAALTAPGRLGRHHLDPTARGLPAQLQAALQVALGHGRGDLDANGLKLDWGQLTPDPNFVHYQRPALGVGAAALLRYMKLLYADAQKVRPGALIDGSAVAPQFGGVLDMIRLYDARDEATWEVRARIISAVDPAAMIDGDDWPVISSQAVAHTVTSTVYGTPASYFLSRWFDGVPITGHEARVLGQIMRLASEKGEGEARSLAGGQWGYFVHGELTARTLAGNTAVALYDPVGCGEMQHVSVVSATDQTLRLRVGTRLLSVRATAGATDHLSARTRSCGSVPPARGAG